MEIIMREEIYKLWLSSLYNIGSRKQNLLLEYFGGARTAFLAPESMVRAVPGLTEHNIQAVLAGRDLNRIELLLREMEAKRMVYISRDHNTFPALLRAIPDPPVGVFYIGELPDESRPHVGVIGSRRCSEYGLNAARMLCKPLARYNIVVVSGMARGIDSMAHKSILEGGGKTIAVLGCGADICYPAQNRALREDIIFNGCVLSEYPPGVKPIPAYFPARNRIIGGLCQAVVVVEAARKSGTLITVGQALDQGRDVMAVPGNIVNDLSEGTNALLRDGASVAASYDDILSVLGITPFKTEETLKDPANQENALAPDEKIVYDSLTFDPVTFDELAVKTNNPANILNYLCMTLEIKGCIKTLPGRRYIRNVK
jgi:DNA processing protein